MGGWIALICGTPFFDEAILVLGVLASGWRSYNIGDWLVFIDESIIIPCGYYSILSHIQSRKLLAQQVKKRKTPGSWLSITSSRFRISSAPYARLLTNQ